MLGGAGHRTVVGDGRCWVTSPRPKTASHQQDGLQRPEPDEPGLDEGRRAAVRTAPWGRYTTPPNDQKNIRVKSGAARTTTSCPQKWEGAEDRQTRKEQSGQMQRRSPAIQPRGRSRRGKSCETDFKRKSTILHGLRSLARASEGREGSNSSPLNPGNDTFSCTNKET